MPTRPSAPTGRRIASLVVCLLALVGCNPHMYDEVPALRDAKRTEIAATWLGFDHTEVTLQPDGKAVLHLLDGQEFDFDAGWRVSGTGTWELTDERMGWNDGQHIRVSLTARTSSTTRTPDPAHPFPSTEQLPIPETYTWTFELQRDKKEQLELSFFFGDPDSRSTYVLERRKP